MMRLLGRFVVLATCVGIAASASRAQDHKTDPRLLFLKGNEALDHRDYETAIAAFSDIVKGGDASGEVHFNFGNALVGVGRIGEAIREYRLAQIALPRDAEVAFNLGIAREMVVDKVAHAEIAPAVKSLLFFHMSTTLEEARNAFVALFVLTLALLHVRVFVRRTWLTRLAVVALSLAMLAGASLLVRTTIAPSPREAVVLSPEAVIRSGPSSDFAETFKLHEGVEVKVEEERNGWLKIDLDGRKGWLSSTSAALIDPLRD